MIITNILLYLKVFFLILLTYKHAMKIFNTPGQLHDHFYVEDNYN